MPEDLNRGRRVGKYEILTRLSVGGMAELFLAFLPGPGGFRKFVALKQILPDVKSDDAFVKMFLDEARITAAFSNANIGQVFELGDENDELYLAMEFISGQNLEQVVKRAAKREMAIPVGFAARVIRDTCLGLHYAHSFVDPGSGKPSPVVHRDVSPKNVMITYTGQVKVIDFGIAKARGRLNRTQAGIVKGTSGYMSPEQVKNEQLDGRTDLFATAVMLHELLVGERLFSGSADASLMLRIVEEEARPPIDVNPYITPEFSDVVLKALSKAREGRFSTGKEMARAIEQTCPDLFEDEQVAEFMGQLFEDKIELTRSLFDQAKASRADTMQLNKAVAGLVTDEAEVGSRVRKPGTRSGTPAKSTASSQRLPKVATGQRPAQRSLKSSQALPKVSSDSGVRRAPAASAGDDTIPPKGRSVVKMEPVKSGSRPKLPPVEALPPKPSVLPKIIIAFLLVGIVAGLGWAVTMGPLKAKLAEATAEEPAPDTSAKPVELKTDPKGKKPKWLVEKEAAEAKLQEEKDRQAAVEAAANDPEVQKALAEANAQLAQLTALEEEQRRLKIEAKEAKGANAQNSRKIEDLQKQIDDMKAMIKAKADKGAAPKAANPGATGTGTAPANTGNDEVVVVNNSKTAKAADVGYLTLHTFNPTSAAVYDGDLKLGSTPLVKAPLDEGTHALRIVDGDSRSRMLSVKIKSGQISAMKAVDVSALPLMK